MRTTVFLGFAALVIVPAVHAQRVQGGAQVVFGDYREISGDLHWRGWGPGAWGSIQFHKFTLEGRLASVKYVPVAGGSATAGFKATQLDGFARYYLANHIFAELGVTNRKADPEFDAQSMAAVRIGARGSYDLGPGASIALRGNYLAGAKFSGGGTAPFAFDISLAVAARATRAPFHFTAHYHLPPPNPHTPTPPP